MFRHVRGKYVLSVHTCQHNTVIWIYTNDSKESRRKFMRHVPLTTFFLQIVQDSSPRAPRWPLGSLRLQGLRSICRYRKQTAPLPPRSLTSVEWVAATWCNFRSIGTSHCVLRWTLNLPLVAVITTHAQSPKLSSSVHCLCESCFTHLAVRVS